jgi:hypothetical protein
VACYSSGRVIQFFSLFHRLVILNFNEGFRRPSSDSAGAAVAWPPVWHIEEACGLQWCRLRWLGGLAVAAGCVTSVFGGTGFAVASSTSHAPPPVPPWKPHPSRPFAFSRVFFI